MFYADNGRIAGRNPIWVQETLKTLVRMFERVGLYKNLRKTKSMTCTPGFIWGQLGKDTYKWQATSKGVTFWKRKRMRVGCDK